MFDNSFIDDIREKADILKIAEGLGLHINKNGQCKCPFHDDEKPSLMIYQKTKTYKCFSGSSEGCSGGDVFKLVMHYNRVNFPEAVKYLANEIGISTPEKNTGPFTKINVILDNIFNYGSATGSPNVELNKNFGFTGDSPAALGEILSHKGGSTIRELAKNSNLICSNGLCNIPKNSLVTKIFTNGVAIGFASLLDSNPIIFTYLGASINTGSYYHLKSYTDSNLIHCNTSLRDWFERSKVLEDTLIPVQSINVEFLNSISKLSKNKRILFHVNSEDFDSLQGLVSNLEKSELTLSNTSFSINGSLDALSEVYSYNSFIKSVSALCELEALDGLASAASRIFSGGIKSSPNPLTLDDIRCLKAKIYPAPENHLINQSPRHTPSF